MNRYKLHLVVLLLMIAGWEGSAYAVPQKAAADREIALTSGYPTGKKGNGLRDLSLKQAINLIRDQYHVIFLYETGLFNGKVVKYDEALPSDAFKAVKAVLTGYNLKVNRLNDHSFVIYPRVVEVNPERAPVVLKKQVQNTITGTVTDASTGESLPGVNILVPGTTIGTGTDVNGHYSLTVPDTADSLRFSYIGYVTQTLPINGRTTIDVQLTMQTISAGQIVVVGYGTQQKRDVTGSISSVEGTEVSKIPTTSVAQSLQGKLAGVHITPNSGQPGASATIYIRGVGTLNDASPLYVVDGMITNDISYLSPDAIASVDVLKDASAEAIYGSRGANGVIIITTKQGSLNQKPQVTLNAYYGMQQIERKISLTNAEQYATLVNELNANEGRPPAFDNPQSLGKGTDWQDVVYQNAPIQNYNLSVSGGSKQVTYSVSANYINQEGIIPKSGYQRITLRVNNTYHPADFVEFGHNLAIMHNFFHAPPDVIGNTYRVVPTVAPKTEDGSFSNTTDLAPVGNPLATIYYTHNRHYTDRIVGNFYADFDILPSLRFHSNFGLDLRREDQKSFSPVFYVSATQQNTESSLTVQNDQTRSWLWDNTLTFQQDFGAHHVKVLGGVTAQGFETQNLQGGVKDLVGTDPSLWYLNAGDASTATNQNTAGNWNMLSYYFRANYSYLDRYLLTATMRADGSSRFGENNKFGYFPAIGVGWRISDESFMQGIDFLNNLKLRASWGKIGNDKINYYPSIPTVGGNLNAVFGPGETLDYGAAIVNLANPDVKWEETTETDIGLESGFLNNRLTAEIDYYFRKTNGILLQVPIPAYVGANTPPYVNAAKVVNYGFDFNVKWSQTHGDFNYGIGVVASTIHNTVRKLGQGQTAIYSGGTGEGGKLATRTIPGEPIGAFYGYKVVGVFQNQEDLDKYAQDGVEQPGDLRYEDINGDGVITADSDRTYLGSPIPSLIFGISLNAGYKGFDFSATFSGQTGNKIYNAKKAARFGTPNFETSYLDRWHGEGTSNWEPRITNGGVNYEVSDRFIEDGSYLKLRNVELGYTLPTRYSQQLRLKEIRVFVNATNVFSITKYNGYTPEVINYKSSDARTNVLSAGIDGGSQGMNYPPTRTISVGVNVSF